MLAERILHIEFDKDGVKWIGCWYVSRDDDGDPTQELGQVNNPILMQFTGLKDKNGKEIYEGDIFQDEEDGSCEFVEWDNEFGGWSTQAWYSVGEFAQAAERLEVIGNIYENPELLNNHV